MRFLIIVFIGRSIFLLEGMQTRFFRLRKNVAKGLVTVYLWAFVIILPMHTLLY